MSKEEKNTYTIKQMKILEEVKIADEVVAITSQGWLLEKALLSSYWEVRKN